MRAAHSLTPLPVPPAQMFVLAMPACLLVVGYMVPDVMIVVRQMPCDHLLHAQRARNSLR